VAEFSGSPTSGAAPLAVGFSDRSTGAPTSWSWDFGDGTGSSAQNPSHTYSTPGTYTVTLTATNAAGSDSETKTGYITVARSTAPLTFAPIADARVHQSEPTTNFGTATSLRAKTSSTSSYQSFLRFSVSGLTGPVQSAKLRMYVTDPSPNGGSISTSADTWSESTVTWNTRPALTSPPITTLGPVSLDTTVEFDLTGAITTNGTYDLALTSTSGDTVYYNSRESAHPPQLVITPAP
jgi:trimeric autotransporter adhesin